MSEVPVGYDGQVAALAAIAKRRAADHALEIRTLAALAENCPPWLDERQEKEWIGKQWVREEIACALGLPPQSVSSMIAEAVYLTTVLPEAVDRLETAEITRAHLRALVEAVVTRSDEVAAAVAARVLPRAGRQTVQNFRRAINRAIAIVDPGGEEDKRRHEYSKRRVVLTRGKHGMSEIWAYLPSDGAQAVYDAVQAIAVGEAAKADETSPNPTDDVPDPAAVPTMDHRRADAFMSLANTPTGDAPRATVHVTVPLSTVMDLSDAPGELAGVGPITAEHAREIAFREGSTWRRLVTDPAGRLIELSSTKYRPPKRLREHVEARDHVCRFPHCRRRASQCEIDHCQARVNGGKTCEHNLHLLCRRHHHLKHEAGWDVCILHDGTTRWTSPLGHVHDVPPYCHPIDPQLGMTEGNVVYDQPEEDAA